MDTLIFNKPTTLFVKETAALRAKFKNIVVTLDSFGAHVSYGTLKLLSDNNIVVLARSAPSTHRTQALDYAVFSQFKTYFRNALNHRNISLPQSFENDIYSLCELLNGAYKQALTYKTIVSGFQACRVWNNRLRGVDRSVMQSTDISNTKSETRGSTLQTFTKQAKGYTFSKNLLRSDEEMLNSGTVNTTAGALFASSQYLGALREREDQRVAAALRLEVCQNELEKRRKAKEREASDKKQEMQPETERARKEHEWLVQRPERARLLSRTRAMRRLMASN